jgi:hypothetical protein
MWLESRGEENTSVQSKHKMFRIVNRGCQTGKYLECQTMESGHPEEHLVSSLSAALCGLCGSILTAESAEKRKDRLVQQLARENHDRAFRREEPCHC